MITTFFLSIPAFLLQALISILPDGGAVPAEWVNAVHLVWSDVNAFSFIVPVSTLLFCVGVAMVFHVAILVFKLFHWIITKIPFIG